MKPLLQVVPERIRLLVTLLSTKSCFGPIPDSPDTSIWIVRPESPVGYHFPPGFRPITEVYVARSIVCLGVVLVALAGGAAHAQSVPPTPADLLKDPAVKAALDAAKANEAQTIEDQIRFCEIPAPSFKEEVRGKELQRVFQQLGLQNVRADKVGNVLGDYPGAAPRPHFVIAAHLDTVFPEGTDVKVKREGALLRGPGIGDTVNRSARPGPTGLP